MPFVERHEEIVKKIPHSSTLKYWVNSALFGLAVFIATNFYIFLLEGHNSIFVANRAAASTAFILIGFSLMLSGICYFWDFFDTKIIYRKYLGITGFVFGLTHALLSTYFYVFVWSNNFGPNVFFSQWNVFGLKISNVVAFAFGLLGLLIFIMMASISNRYAARELGGIWWRRLLRFGYLAYVFIILHFAIKRSDEWLAWLDQTQKSLPPISLLLLLLGLAVLGIRVALQISLIRKKAAKKREDLRLNAEQTDQEHKDPPKL